MSHKDATLFPGSAVYADQRVVNEPKQRRRVGWHLKVAKQELRRARRGSASWDVRARDSAREVVEHPRGVRAVVECPRKADLERSVPRIQIFRAHLPSILVAATGRNISSPTKRKRGGGGETHANGTLRSTGASSHPSPSVRHRSANARQTRARTSAAQLHVQRRLGPGAPQNVRRSAGANVQPAAIVRTSTSAQRRAQLCARVVRRVGLPHESLFPLHKPREQRLARRPRERPRRQHCVRVAPERADHGELHRRVRARVRCQVNLRTDMRCRRRFGGGNQLDLRVAEDILHERDRKFSKLPHQIVVLLVIVVVV